MTESGNDMLAAEYVLGLLEGEELARARNLVRQDEAFGREVAAWAMRTAPLLAQYEAVEPPKSVWRNIEQRISRNSQDRMIGKVGKNVVPLHRRVGFWQALAGGATALAASLALVLVAWHRPATQLQVPPQSQRSPQPMLAMLESDDGEMEMFATWNPAGRRLTVAAVAPSPPRAGRSHELWMIGSDGKPHSMGVMPEKEMMSVKIASSLADRLSEGVTLAVSDEPSGGSPTGTPTGPVIATGKLQRA